MLYIYQLKELTLLGDKVSRIIPIGISFLHNQEHLLRTSVQGRNRQTFMVNQNGKVYPSSLLANNSKPPSYPEIKETAL